MTAPGESPALLFDVMDTLVYDPYREMADFFGMPARDLYAAANAEAPRLRLDRRGCRSDRTCHSRTSC